ncbi:hypothetical protein [Hyphomonas sp.]|uniref:hypothetical protein n=1 Tax=Hyphomonas sp. TaxID=87 RepID=UPI00391AA7B6
MTFTPVHLFLLLMANWPRAKRLVDWAVSVLKLDEDGRAERWRLNEAARILRPAESLVRRMLVILACQRLLSDPPALAASPARAGQRNQSADGPVRPPFLTFSLLDPALSFRTEPPAPRPTVWPSIWSPGQVRVENLDVTGPDPLERIDAAGFLARAKRLAAALADPDPFTARLARWLSRARAAPPHEIRRRLPIRPAGYIPGRHSAALDSVNRSSLTYTHWGAEAALSGLWNSS